MQSETADITSGAAIWRTQRNVSWRPKAATTWQIGWNMQVIFDSGLANPLCENVVIHISWWSLKYITYCRQRRTKPWPQVMYRKFFDMLMCGFWHMWADRQTDMLMAILCTFTRGAVINRSSAGVAVRKRSWRNPFFVCLLTNKTLKVLWPSPRSRTHLVFPPSRTANTRSSRLRQSRAMVLTRRWNGLLFVCSYSVSV